MTGKPRAVVIGSSAGGMHALRCVLADLGADFPCPVVAVCHTGSDDMSTFCELVGAHCALPVREARERERVVAGVVHVAPTGYHLLIEGDGRFALSVDERVAFARPAIDILFETAATAFAAELVGVVMTGANSDGAAGLRRVRERGGIGIVQDPADAEVATMPQSALDIAGADFCLPLREIGPKLNRLCRV